MTPSAEDQLEIGRALTAYCGGIDTKDYELFRSAFTDDVFAEYGEWCGPFENLDQLAAYMEAVHRRLDGSLHRLSNLYVVEFDGDTALVRSYVDAALFQSGHPDGPLLNANGMYADELRRQGDGWRISRKRYDHLYETGNPGVLAAEEALAAVAAL